MSSGEAPHDTGFVCGVEASALLNCVASKQYNEAKCKPLQQKLRACIEKKVTTACPSTFLPSLCIEKPKDKTWLGVLQKVVKFSLLPDEEVSASSAQPAKKQDQPAKKENQQPRKETPE